MCVCMRKREKATARQRECVYAYVCVRKREVSQLLGIDSGRTQSPSLGCYHQHDTIHVYCTYVTVYVISPSVYCLNCCCHCCGCCQLLWCRA